MFALTRWAILAIMVFSPLAADARNWSKSLAKVASTSEDAKGSSSEEESGNVDLLACARGCRHRTSPIQRLAAIVLDSWITTHRTRTATVTARDGGFSFLAHELSWRNGCGSTLLC